MLEKADAFQERAVLRTGFAFVPKSLQKCLKFSQEGCWGSKIQGKHSQKTGFFCTQAVAFCVFKTSVLDKNKTTLKIEMSFLHVETAGSW